MTASTQFCRYSIVLYDIIKINYLIQNDSEQLVFFIKQQYSLLKMGRKDKKVESDSESSSGSSEHSEKEVEEQVIDAIKKLPTVEEKVQAIAMNTYLIEKRELDEKMQNEISQVEAKYRKKYLPQVEQINKIVNGEFDFTDADYQEIGNLLTEEELNVKHNYFTKEPISEYWLKVFMSSDIGGEVHERDEPLLKHLTKIDTQKSEDGKKLSATFYFSENAWFTNTSLKKEFDLDGDTIERSYGDKVEWKQGKNITIKIVKKKKKKGGEKKTKEVREQSFFNLFENIEIESEDEGEEDEGNEKDIQKLESQYELVNSLYEIIVPRSLEYYLGIASVDIGEECDSFGQEEEEQLPKKKKNK